MENVEGRKGLSVEELLALDPELLLEDEAVPNPLLKPQPKQVNQPDAKAIVKSLNALFSAGDVVEIRAFPKNSAVIWCGFYTNWNKAAKDITLMCHGELVDCYVCTNPVGDEFRGTKLNTFGEATQGAGSKAKGIPRRCNFLIDIDTIRDPDHKGDPATAEELSFTRRTMEAVYGHLMDLGWRELLIATSGNGYHILPKIDLPNEVESEVLLTRVQLYLKSKFETPNKVKIDCFKDANRLTRLYGTVNVKGKATKERPYRRATIFQFPAERQVISREQLESVAALCALAIQAERHDGGHGNAEGWMLEEFFDARNWAHKPYKEDVWDVECPWESEHSQDSKAGTTTSAVIDGKFTSNCLHNSCQDAPDDDGLHRKREWKDFRKAIDPTHEFKFVMEDDTDYSKLVVEDTDIAEDDPEVLPSNSAVTVVESESEPKPEPEKEPETGAIGKPEPSPAEEPKKIRRLKLYAMPESVLYGYLGEMAHKLQSPLGFAYPSLIAVYAGSWDNINANAKSIRPNIFVLLVADVAVGKSRTIQRSLKVTGSTESPRIYEQSIGSGEGLVDMLDGTKDAEYLSFERIAKPCLIVQDEMRETMNKMGIDGTSLPHKFNELFYKNEISRTTRGNKVLAYAKASLLAGLTVESQMEFAEVFGKGSVTGLYDRFIYAIAPANWRFDSMWEEEERVQPEARKPSRPKVTKRIFDMKEDWEAVDKTTRGTRLGEIALRVALITSAANGDSEITVTSMLKALELCEWQETIRANYKPSRAEVHAGKISEMIMEFARRQANDFGEYEWWQWRTAYRKFHWDRMGASQVTRERDALVKDKILEEAKDEGGSKLYRAAKW